MLSSSPYTNTEWQTIQHLGQQVEQSLQEQQVGLLMGGEPTFISIDDFESPQWTIAALGDEKFAIAQQLLQKLQHRFNHPGSILLHSIGKSYPGESIPRWALGCYWREDGLPIWHNPTLLAPANPQLSPCTDPYPFLHHLTQLLHLNPAHILPAYEPDTDLNNDPAGYVLPLLPIDRDPNAPTSNPIWTSCTWELPTPSLELLPGSAPIGLRLPLHQLPKDHLLTEAHPTLHPNEPITLP
ncbi:transglutaminase family protein, partial [Alkalinema pantanalense CENA528]|uniref:transglutaminase family protein n=1 Tax=Alkalinema pantanalense TaxID=1620705 RepID=UPI003D6ED8D4